MKELEKMDQLKQIFRPLRNSPEYWVVKKKDLCAAIKQLGIPSFFGSLSPAEIDWIELLVVIAKTILNPNITKEHVEEMPREEKFDLLRRDPVTTARCIHNRLCQLFNFIINRVSGPFAGEHPVIDYYFRVERSVKGSQHLHYFLWCENSPKYNLLNSPRSEENIKCIEFIDKYTTCSINDDEDDDENASKELRALIKYQRHRHKENCEMNFWKKDDYDANEESRAMSCKYGFPWPILEETLILEPLRRKTVAEIEIFEKARTRYAKIIKPELDKMADFQEYYIAIKKKLNLKKPRTIYMKEFLEILNISFVEYVEALRSYIERITVFLKRNSSEIMINPFNKIILRLHRGNMDLQYIYHSYAVIAYVTAYMMKNNAKISRLMDNAIQSVKQGNKTIRQKLYRLADVFQNSVEVSAQECTYHLLSMPVSKMSRKTLFVPTFPPNERCALIKPKDVLEKMKHDSTNIFNMNLLDYYIARPEEFEYMCLAEFSAWYEVITESEYIAMTNPNAAYDAIEEKADDDSFDNVIDSPFDELEKVQDDEEDQEEAEETVQLRRAGWNKNPVHALMNDVGYMRKLTKAKILKYRGYKKDKQPNLYYREQLQLYTAWRDESTEIDRDDRYFEHFNEKKEEIAKNRAEYEKIYGNENESEALERITKEIQDAYTVAADAEARKLLEVNDKLQQKNYEHSDSELEELEEEFGFRTAFDNPELKTKMLKGVNLADDDINDDNDETNSLGLYDDTTYSQLMTQLNKRQHRFLINVLKIMKDKQSCYYFVRGCSGTGKSHLIKALYQSLYRFFNYVDTVMELNISDEECTDSNIEEEEENKVKRIKIALTAYTGMAAFNIRGCTLHTSLGLLRKMDSRTTIEPLSSEARDRLKKAFKQLRLLIIDEISMVNMKIFGYVDQRLQQIMNNEQPFGGVSVIAFGDFNQLKPVTGSWIFASTLESDNRYHALQPYETNRLWDMMRMFELTEIMRQREEKEFAEALTAYGELGLLGLSEAQIALFDSRIVQNPLEEITDNAIFLFQRNVDVDNYNEQKINRMRGSIFINEAIDKIIGNKNDQQDVKKQRNFLSYVKSLDKSKTEDLASELSLIEGAKYMITRNQWVDDGIANGTRGVLKYIQKNANKTHAIRLFFDFLDSTVGRLTRRKFWGTSDAEAKKLQPPRPPRELIEDNWTPLELSHVKLNLKIEGHTWHMQRSQFQITLAEAVTICKIQGNTCPAVAIDLNQQLNPSEMYVAMSRVTKAKDLFLYGKHSIMDRSKYKDMDSTRIEREKRYMYNTRKPLIETRRLRERAPFLDTWSFLKDDEELNETEKNLLKKSCIVYYHNLDEKPLDVQLPFIRADYGVKTAQILVFSQCKIDLNRVNELTIDGFRMVRPIFNDGQQISMCSGALAVYIRDDVPNTRFKIVDNSKKNTGLYESKNKPSIEMGLLILKMNEQPFNVCYVNNNEPDQSKLLKELTTFLNTNVCNEAKNHLFLVGNININALNTEEGEEINEEAQVLEIVKKALNDKHQLKNIINESTHDEGKMLTWCMSNCSQNDKYTHETVVYESYYSRHKPIMLLFCLPKKDNAKETNFYNEIANLIPYIKTKIQKCKKPFCGSCSTILEVKTKSIASINFNKKEMSKIDFKRVANCQDTGGIYLIICVQCFAKYVGQTDRTFRERIGEHLRDVTCMQSTAIGNHFNNGKCFRCHFRWIILASKITDGNERRKLESHYIDELMTLTPNGLNTKF